MAYTKFVSRALTMASSHQHIFFLQSDRDIGRVSDRRASEDLAYAIANEPFEKMLSNRRQIGSSVSHRRLKFACGVLLALFFLFLGRSAHLQIVQGKHFKALAEANQYRVARILSQRGMIYDRDGVILAKNVPSFMLTMTIADLPSDPQIRRQVFEKVSELSGLQPTDLDLLLTQYANIPTEFIPVKQHIPYERAMHLAIETKHLPGFTLQISQLREYPATTSSFSHILGYTGKISNEEYEELFSEGYKPIDLIGKSGIEKSAESQLRGIPGEEVLEVDARGRSLAVVSKTNPIPGKDISLTIDAGLQSFIEGRMMAMFDRLNTSRGSVIALNPQTGEIYALVSLPAYDNNAFAKGISQDTYQALITDENRPLFSRAVSGEFSSGSTFKPFLAYAALAEGLINEHTSFVSTGGLRIGEWFFPDWRAGGHGVIDVTKAIADSVNTFFYIIGGGYDQFIGLGVSRMTDYARRFGFGEPTGIDLPSEGDGFLPSKQWKEEVKGERWYVGDTYHLSIGQGDFLTTPLQMARAMAIMANGGKLITPYLIQKTSAESSSLMEGLDREALTIVRRAMRETVLNGSGRSLATLPVSVAGKTGTVQAPAQTRLNSWFTGFAPYENPEIAIVVLIEEGGESTDAAVPLAKEIFSWWFLSGQE